MSKTITDIVPPSRRRAMENGESMNASTSPSMDAFGPAAPATPPPPPPMRPTMNLDTPNRKGGFPWKLAVVAAVVVIASVGAMYAFSGAKVTITPVVNSITVSGEFSSTPATGELPFELVSVEKTGIQEVPSEGTENANDPAQGTITIYNAQAKVQELIKNTRFETPDGLIFRIHESVKVPAGTTDAPGTVQAIAYADVGGEKYNIGPSTFTLPGLKGSAAFEAVYAKSESSMSGGFSGVRPSVSQATKDAQSEKIQSGLAGELATAIAAATPEGYVLIPGSTVISYVQMPATAGDDNKTVNVSEKGTATALVFPKEALAKAIAYQTLGVYAGQPVTLTSAEGLTLTPKEGNAISPGVESFAFTLTGTTKITWIVDAEKIAGSVAGKSRNAAETMLAGFPEIEKAVLSLKPFWAGSMPEDPAEIKIIVETDEAD